MTRLGWARHAIVIWIASIALLAAVLTCVSEGSLAPWASKWMATTVTTDTSVFPTAVNTINALRNQFVCNDA